MNKSLIRQIAWPTLFAAIGASLTLGILHLKRENTRFADPEGYYYGKKNWIKLPPGKGPELISNFREDQKRIWPHYFRLRVGSKDSILRGFWIDKAMLADIDQNVLNQGNTEPVTGYHVFLGKWDTAGKRFYSLVVRATVKDSKNANKDTGEGDFYDMVEPCPDNCGGN